MAAKKRARTKSATHWYDKTKSIIGSELFFRLTLVLFVLQAGIIAIISGFPLAFDEGYHLGIINLHAQQLSPFFSNLPDWTGQFGALATDPSYLYHYIMSFPYRLITAITDNTFLIVLFLRVFSIAFFVLGIILFRKVLKFTGASNALINLVLLALVLLPLQTFTAAHINYDNLLFPATAAALLFCLQFAEKLRTDKQFDPKNFTLTIATCMLATQVKYVFLPIFAAIIVFLTFIIGRWLYKERRDAVTNIHHNIKVLSTRAKFLLIGLILLSSGLFIYRFGYNIVNYQSINPDCSTVLSTEVCMQWGPWARNHDLRITGNNTQYENFGQEKAFAKLWVGMMSKQLLTIINGTQGGITLEPTNQLFIGAGIIVILGGILLVLHWRKIQKKNHATGLILLVSGAYLSALIYTNYSQFVEFGIPVAIQGRYLLPILLLMMILLAQAYSLALKTKPGLKLVVLAFVVIVGIQGGGIITYAIRANDESWRWSDTAIIPAEDLRSTQANQTGIRR